MAENKKNLAVTIQTKELKFAIMNKTHVTARSLQAAGKLNYEAAAHMQASEDLENSYELIRAISNAIAETKVELGEYLNETVTAMWRMAMPLLSTSCCQATTTVLQQMPLVVASMSLLLVAPSMSGIVRPARRLPRHVRLMPKPHLTERRKPFTSAAVQSVLPTPLKREASWQTTVIATARQQVLTATSAR